MKSEKYDALIIGTGQAGKPLAHALAGKGWKVCIIEKNLAGGSCINYGCTPTKAMIASAGVAYMAERSKDFGIDTGKVKVDFNAVMKRKDKIVISFRKSIEKSFKKNKNITFISGTASFEGRKDVIVRTKNISRRLTSDKIFINTGTQPAIPPVKGLDTINYLTSSSLLELKKLPEHLIILGGSYIGLEFGQMFRRFGSRITIIERSDNIISREDEDISTEVRNILEEEGIKIFTSADISEIGKNKTGKISLKIKRGRKYDSLTGSHLLLAAGVTPDVSSLNLENAGIETDKRGFIKVNEKLETNVKGIYALGDVKGGPAFTHISYDDHRIVYSNLILKKKRSTRDRLVPYTLFTDPPLGRIGMTEKEAREKKINFKIAMQPMKHVARAIEAGESKGLMKAIVDAKSHKILGCAILGMEGGELMAMIEIAMMGNLKYEKLRDAIFSHPTLSEALNNLFLKTGK